MIVDGSVGQLVPQERVHGRRIVEVIQTSRVPVEVIQVVLVERIKDRVADQMVDIPVPPVMEDIVAVVQEVVNDGSRASCGFASPQTLEETIEVVRLVPRQRIDEQIVELFIPQMSVDSVGELKILPQEHFKERIIEQIVDVPVPQVDVLEVLEFQVRAISYEVQELLSEVRDLGPGQRSCVGVLSQS